MKVYFVGAGAGAPDLLTLRAERLLRCTRCCIYAGSLVSPELLKLTADGAALHNSAIMTLEQTTVVCLEAARNGMDVVRLHTGDTSIYSAIGEQIAELSKHGIAYEVVPGISAFQAAAAILGAELTAPEISQTVILSRVAGRTPVPEEQALGKLAATQATLCLYLSVNKVRAIAHELIRHYGPDCPAAVVFHASWPDEQVIRATLADLADKTEAAGITRTALIVVGHALTGPQAYSKLYDKTFSHACRTAEDAPRAHGADQKSAVSTHLLTLSAEGLRIAKTLSADLPGCIIYVHRSVPEPGDAFTFDSVMTLTADLFSVSRRLVYIMPTGVAVRAISPHLVHKKSDPAVVAVDVGGRYAISLLSGHEGGANTLAMDVANSIGAEPVISTTTDAVKTLVVGVGCRCGKTANALEHAIRDALAKVDATLDQVRLLASVDIKRHEPGLLEVAQQLNLPLRFIASSEIRGSMREFEHSDFVQASVGLPAVAEPAALLAGRKTTCLLKKTLYPGITIAIARENCWS